jgi:hypothetical protein
VLKLAFSIPLNRTRSHLFGDGTATANTDPLTQLASFRRSDDRSLSPTAAIEKLEVHRDRLPQEFSVIDILLVASFVGCSYRLPSPPVQETKFIPDFAYYISVGVFLGVNAYRSFPSSLTAFYQIPLRYQRCPPERLYTDRHLPGLLSCNGAGRALSLSKSPPTDVIPYNYRPFESSGLHPQITF